MDPNPSVTVTWVMRPGGPGCDAALAKMEMRSAIGDTASIHAVQDLILPDMPLAYMNVCYTWICCERRTASGNL